MRIVFDIDNTITIKHGEDYTIDSLPNQPMIDVLNKLYDKGYTIVLYTARKMESSKHNIGLAIANGGYNTFKWLEKHGVKYHEIFFGKPNTDTMYIDDKAFGYNEEKVLTYLNNLVKE
jgi:capsule biosynthesis phosphatase